MRKAIFFDKDGTLIPDIPYNTDVDKITLSDGADFAIKALSTLGFSFFVVSNQAGVAHGLISEKDLMNIHAKLISSFAELGEELTGFYYCPHDINGKMHPYNISCECRKPLPGMVLNAAKEHSIDLQKSWMIGDILNDIEAGNRAGCKTILIDNGNETEWTKGEFRTPDYTVKDLIKAAQIIVSVCLTDKEVRV